MKAIKLNKLISITIVFLVSVVTSFPAYTATDNERSDVLRGSEWTNGDVLSCSATDDPAVATSGPGKIFLLGDSLSVGIKDPLQTQVNTAGTPWSLASDTKSSRTIDVGDNSGTKAVVGNPAGLDSDTSYVVIVLGTNQSNASTENIEGLVTAVKEKASRAKIYWLSVNTGEGSGVDNESFNTNLSKVTGINIIQNTVNSWGDAQKVHYGPEGYGQLASTIFESIISEGLSTEEGGETSSNTSCIDSIDIGAMQPEINTDKKNTFSGELISPTGVVLHWTGGSPDRTVDEFITDIQSNTACGEGGCSVQFYIDGSGTIYQLVNLINTKTAHAAGYNSCCIGIEIGGRGASDLLGNEKQMKSVISLTAYLVKKFNMQPGPDIAAKKGILSHHAISDNGKMDVGDEYWTKVVLSVMKVMDSGETPPYLTEVQAGWLRSAGIPESDWEDVNYVISHESSWNPTAQNPTSTAYGLAQFLNGTWATVGCTKTSDPVQQLICADKYAKQRYGSWAGAVEHWKTKNWW